MPDVFAGHRNPVWNAVEQSELHFKGAVSGTAFNSQHMPVSCALSADNLLGDDRLLLNEYTSGLFSNVITNEGTHIVKGF